MLKLIQIPFGGNFGVLKLFSYGKSMRIWLAFLIVCNSIFIVPAFANPLGGKSHFLGEVKSFEKNDTLYLHYHLTPNKFEPDSVKLSIGGAYSCHIGEKIAIKIDVNGFNDTINYVTIFRNNEVVPFNNEWRSVSKKKNRIYLDGDIKIPLDSEYVTLWSCEATGYLTDSTGNNITLDNDEYISPYYSGWGMELFYPSFGYFKSSFDSPLNDEGLFLGYGLSWEFNFAKSRLSFSTSWSGLGKNFAFSEPFRVGYRYYSGTKQNFYPSFYTAAKLSKIKLKRDEIEYRDLDWGGEFGVAFEGPFERIGYHYSTACGGYHTLELFIAAVSFGNGKGGTRYLLEKADNIWMVRISFHIEGWNSLAGSRVFIREMNRPFFYKILGYAGLIPSLPILGIDHLLAKKR